MTLDPAARSLIRLAVAEDLGLSALPRNPRSALPRDLSTDRFLPKGLRLRGRFIARRGGVLCGTAAASEVFRLLAPGARLRWLVKDGGTLRPGTIIGRVEGGREILTAERTALNFLQRLSGVATLTRAFVRRVRGTRARVYDTRKTTPGWRGLEKYAVRCGGGLNHRMGLHDMVMLKDNHLAAWMRQGALSSASSLMKFRSLIARFRRSHPRISLLVEAKTHREALLALRLGADVILLDNMPPSRLKAEIGFLRRSSPAVRIEVSGGVDLPSVRRLARLGPDRISVGRLTHSAPALDISLEIETL
ncbi:MAG: carboxylating nicotinate-nucleotide diphosphorylase [Elusimicrobiota bacterium]